MKTKRAKTIGQIFEEGTLIDKALRQAVQDAIQEHRKTGHPLAVWKDGKTVWVQPDELEALTDGNGNALRSKQRKRRVRG